MSAGSRRGAAADAVLAADPGLTRLGNALRGTGTWLGVVVPLLVGTGLLDLPARFVLPGVLLVSVATMSLGMIPRERSRAVPILLQGVAGVIGLSAGALVFDHPVARTLVFLLLGLATLGASLAGPAGTLVALGGVGSFYGATLLRPSLAELPIGIAVTVVAALLAALWIGVLLRERPARAAARSLRSLAALARAVARANAEGPDAVRLALERLAAATVETRSRIIVSPRGWPARYAVAEGAALGEWESAVVRATAGAGRRAVIDRLADELTAPLAKEGGDAARAALRGAPAETLSELGGRSLVSTAVQLIVAAVASLLVAQLIDARYWFWCVLAALVMLFGTSSAADSLGKGFRRVLGTAAGLPVGTLFAHLAADDLILFALLFVAVMFAQQYLADLAYGWSVFFLTVMLALLFMQAGAEPLPALETRVLLTTLGVLIGAIVAVVVLPTRTGPLLRRRAVDVLAAADAVLAGIRARGPVEGVDRAAQAAGERFLVLRAEARAAGGMWRRRGESGALAQQLALGALSVREVRAAAVAYTGQPLGVEGARRADSMRARAGRLRMILDAGSAQPTVAEAPPVPQPADDRAASDDLDDVLLRLDAALTGLESRIGAD